VRTRLSGGTRRGSGGGANNSGSGPQMPAPSEFYYRHILLYRELVTEEDFRVCDDAMRQAVAEGRDEPTLTDALLELGFLSPSQLRRIEEDMQVVLEGGSRPDGFGPRIPGYRIAELTAETATGPVYKGFQKSLQRFVSVKVLNPEFLTDREAVGRYYAEAAAAARAGHPNVVQLVDLGFDPTGALYIVRELVEGESVQQMLEQRGRVEPDDAANIVLGVARGLSHLHGIGLIHGHIRPSNILVPRDRIAKLQDLGISRSVPDSGESGRRRILGNPLYMSPEQVRGVDQIDGGADIYALGAVFYHMLAGKPPFLAENAPAVFAKHLNDDPVPPEQVAPEVSPKLSRIVLKMLGKAAEQRYATTDQLCVELEEYCRRRARDAAARMGREASMRLKSVSAGSLAGMPKAAGDPKGSVAGVAAPRSPSSTQSAPALPALAATPAATGSGSAAGSPSGSTGGIKGGLLAAMLGTVAINIVLLALYFLRK